MKWTNFCSFIERNLQLVWGSFSNKINNLIFTIEKAPERHLKKFLRKS